MWSCENLLKKINLNSTDKHICNYLLLDEVDQPFDPVNSRLETIFDRLSKRYSNTRAYELMVSGLWSMGISVHLRRGECPHEVYKKHSHQLNAERLYFIEVFKNCTNDDLAEMLKVIFNQSSNTTVSCVHFFKTVSEQKDDNFEKLKIKINEFLSRLERDTIWSDNMEMDGKGLKRVRISPTQSDIEKVCDINLNDYYDIKHNRDNLCLIFNNSSRKGSDFDVKLIKETFENINGFKVKIREIIEKEQFFKDLKGFTAQNSDNSDMIVCFFMSHGEEGYIFDQNEQKIAINDITNLFTAENVPSLAKKPKIFFFQACRGTSVNKVIQFDSPITENREKINVTNPFTIEGVPNNSDFFFAFSTLSGQYSLRRPESGSLFINQLCLQIKENSKKMSLDNMCIMINKNYEKELIDNVIITQLCEIRKNVTRFNIYLEKPCLKM